MRVQTTIVASAADLDATEVLVAERYTDRPPMVWAGVADTLSLHSSLDDDPWDWVAALESLVHRTKQALTAHEQQQEQGA